mgnify:CR=1 FL=1
MPKRKILVAPLNWGLGHATRCIPIIKALLNQNFEPILASDGMALQLLKKEFPQLKSILLPSYHITYPEKGNLLKWKLIWNSPKIYKAIKAEKKLTKSLVEKYKLKGIISDNRLGVRSKQVKSVYITHQLNLLSGNTTFLSRNLHRYYIEKFDECWIPDFQSKNNLSGKLSQTSEKDERVKFIGPLSRFEQLKCPILYKYGVILSGPEPQRSLLEQLLLAEFENTEDQILFIRGVVSKTHDLTSNNPNIHIRNYSFGHDLQKEMNMCRYIIARSGYTSIMDICKLEKKAYFIPTPGQYEQLYLAERLKQLGMAASCHQHDFTFSKLEKIEEYSGLFDFNFRIDFNELFTLFQSK